MKIRIDFNITIEMLILAHVQLIANGGPKTHEAAREQIRENIKFYGPDVFCWVENSPGLTKDQIEQNLDGAVEAVERKFIVNARIKQQIHNLVFEVYTTYGGL